jgi:phosphoribosylformylglycinamidine cyclo-ligase
MRYRDAGVDVGRSDAVKHDIVRDAASTWTPAVRRLRGGFAGVMEWPAGEAAGVPPLLAATMDGVGTKLHVALAAGRVADAAADLVYHGANDLLVHGARPLAMLDYVAQARLAPGVVREIVRGLAAACREVGAVLLGGETAEMPDTYVEGVVDVAGCMIGWVDPAALRDGGAVRPGDVLLGLASQGLHTNGFSLARRVLSASGLELDSLLPGGAGETVGQALLARHRWYGPALAAELALPRVRAMAHVTGGGIAGNLVRVLPEGCRAVLEQAWPRPALFTWLCTAGAVPEDDAREALNLGIGFVVVAAAGEDEALAADLAARGEVVFRLGAVHAGTRGVEWDVRG